MRAIKFRAWDKTKRVITRPLASLIFGLGGDIREISEHDGYVGEIFSPISNIVLMQFTGLLDKNGKEIYEGDIIQGRNKGKFIIEWFQPYCGFCYCNKEEAYPLNENMNIKVIGNIYENPELI